MSKKVIIHTELLTNTKKRIDKKQTAPYLTMLGVLWIVGKQVVFQRALALSLIAVSTYSSILSKLRTARMTVE